MTAPALNIGQTAHAGPQGHGATAVAGAQATGPLAGFEALLAALFPQADPAAPGAGAGKPAPLVSPTVSPEEPADKAAGDADPAATTISADASVGDAAAALAASLAAVQTDAALAPAETTAPATDATDDSAPPAWGRDKAPGGPAQPALLNANPHARLAAKSGATSEAAPGTPGETTTDPAAEPPPAIDAQAETLDATLTAETKATPPTASDAAAKAEAPAWGRDKAQAVPAAPALENANPKANLAEKAAQPAVEAPPVETPPLATPPAEPIPAPLASLAQRPEPAPPPAPAGRAVKSERARALTDAGPSPDAEPADAPGKPVLKAAEAAARPAAAAVETADAKPEHAKPAELDAPDAALQAETRASQSAAPAAIATHVVRGSPETVANLAAQIVKKLEARTTRFDLQLDPAGLGKVDVRVEIGAHGRLTAAMTCDNPQAAAELRSRASELQRALEQAGFELAGGLSFDVAGDRGGRQGQAWQGPDENNGGAFRGQAFRAALETAGDADAAAQGALKLRRGVNAGLDLRI
jgi:flagellar hook-length control protein FliK